jgi:hypothetical protein
LVSQIVINEYSRYTWRFPLRATSDVSSILHDFYAHVLNQFSLSIHCVQCDNNREFDNGQLRSFLYAKGIVFRCSYLIHRHEMERLSVASILSTTSFTPYFSKPILSPPTRWRLFTQRLTSLIVAPIVHSNSQPHMRPYSFSHQIIPTFAPFDAYAFQI